MKNYFRFFFGKSKAEFESTPLHKAAGNCDAKGVEILLGRGSEVNALDAEGNTPLRITASIQVARMLLKKGADVTIRNNDGLTCLHRAANIVNAGLLDLYLKAGADPNVASSNGTTPLITASRSSFNYQMAALLKRGAKVDVKNNRKNSPMNHTKSQTMRPLCLFLAGLDELINETPETKFRRPAVKLRQKVINTIVDPMLSALSPPGDEILGDDFVWRTWDANVAVATQIMLKSLNAFEKRLFQKYPELCKQVGAARDRSDVKHEVLMDEVRELGKEEFQRRLQEILDDVSK